MTSGKRLGLLGLLLSTSVKASTDRFQAKFPELQSRATGFDSEALIREATIGELQARAAGEQARATGS